MEKEFLAAHNIPFTDYNVAADMEKRKYIVELTGQMGVPVTVITDLSNPAQTDVLVGFSQALFEQKLGMDQMKMAA
jgi:glutaredoxin